MKMEIFATHSIAKEVNDKLLEVRCPKCHRFLFFTFYEVRMEKAASCPNCEAWVPLWDKEGMFQGLYEVAMSVDRAIRISYHL